MNAKNLPEKPKHKDRPIEAKRAVYDNAENTGTCFTKVRIPELQGNLPGLY